jgi:hypothetical protein
MMIRNIDDVIEKIKLLEIREGEYEWYKKILSLPKNLFLVIMFSIIDGKLKPSDFNIIMSYFRNETYKYHNLDISPIEKRLWEKYNVSTVTQVIINKQVSNEQSYIYNKLTEIGIPVGLLDMNKIFVDELNLEEITLDFSKIILSNTDKEFMRKNSLGELQMKKLKLLNNYILLSKPYKESE